MKLTDTAKRPREVQGHLNSSSSKAQQRPIKHVKVISAWQMTKKENREAERQTKAKAEEAKANRKIKAEKKRQEEEKKKRGWFRKLLKKIGKALKTVNKLKKA